MKTTNTDNQLAISQIDRAIERVAIKYPFLARVLERLIPTPNPDIATMGVAVRGDDVTLVYSPAFVVGLSMAELIGVLLHECYHVVFRHILARPEDFPDQWARTVAEEVTVNEFVKEPLPGEPVVLANVPGLPPMESTSRRYDRLKTKKSRPSITKATAQTDDAGSPPPKNGCQGKTDGGGQPGNQGGCGSKAQPAENESTNAPSQQSGAHLPSPGNGGQPGQAGQKPSKSGSAKVLGTLFDDHDIWAEARNDPERSAKAVQGVLRDAASLAGRENIPEELLGELEDVLPTLSETPGDSAGNNSEELQDAQGRSLPWEQLLRRYLGRLLQPQPDFRYPSRRSPELVGISPVSGGVKME